ncbi:MAG TPA: 30S ribosomal protein S7 [Planctomycetota bacterium]|nr:30S ribosomal protein S7 [Planctomycetota bacterium]
MAKKFESTERFLKPDPKYRSMLVGKFINCVMKCGKKSTAERVFYQAAALIEERNQGIEFLKFFEAAIANIKPAVEVRSRRVGGANYQVPVPVTPKRQMALAFRWILEGARGGKGKPMHIRLADELCNAYKHEGHAATQRENTHRMAEANKAFAHYAW